MDSNNLTLKGESDENVNPFPVPTFEQFKSGDFNLADFADEMQKDMTVLKTQGKKIEAQGKDTNDKTTENNKMLKELLDKGNSGKLARAQKRIKQLEAEKRAVAKAEEERKRRANRIPLSGLQVKQQAAKGKKNQRPREAGAEVSFYDRMQSAKKP